MTQPNWQETKLKIMVQATKDRPRYLSLLRTSLDFFNYEYAGDSIASESLDDSGSSLHGLMRLLRLGLSHNPGSILVLQEDIVVCRDFLPTVEKLSTIAPGKMISFFTPSVYQTNKALIEKSDFWYCQAYLLPSNMAQEILAFDSNAKSDDQHINMYLKSTNQTYMQTDPSLVEHIGWNETTTRHEKSRLQNMNREARTASNFIGLENSGLDIDWSTT